MATIFTKIRTGEIPGYILDDSGEFFAFLDINPRQPGHTLVVPYLEEDYVFDLDAETYSRLWEYVREVADVLKNVTGKTKIAVVVEGMQVPHSHVHLIPIDSEGQLKDGFVEVSSEDMEKFVNDYQNMKNNS